LSKAINKAIETDFLEQLDGSVHEAFLIDSLYNLIDYRNIKAQPINMAMYFLSYC
jgi:hypothetical protein